MEESDSSKTPNLTARQRRKIMKDNRDIIKSHLNQLPIGQPIFDETGAPAWDPELHKPFTPFNPDIDEKKMTQDDFEAPAEPRLALQESPAPYDPKADGLVDVSSDGGEVESVNTE